MATYKSWSLPPVAWGPVGPTGGCAARFARCSCSIIVAVASCATDNANSCGITWTNRGMRPSTLCAAALTAAVGSWE
eukprot:12925759-Prorocentrum_lima.AAC.1